VNSLYTADYVLCAVTLAAAVLGLFGGFSGALGFFAGSAAAGMAVKFGWSFARSLIQIPWVAAVATLVAALLAFGIARAVVRRIVRGLLAQPADAIFGSLVAAVTGAALAGAALVFAERMLGRGVDSVIVRVVMGCFG